MKTECKKPLSSGLSLEGSSRPATGQLARTLTSSTPTSPTANNCCCSCYCRCVGTYRMTHAPDAMSSSSSTSSASKNATNSWNIQADQDILSQASRSLQLALVTESDTDNEDPPDKETELSFYNDDGSCKTVVVESNLCSGDLCQLLALKNHVAKDSNWSIIEYWPEYGIERTLEDYEKVYCVYQSMMKFDPATDKRFIFRKDFRKYEMFRNPQQFFPSEMVDFSVADSVLTDSPALAKIVAMQEILNAVDGCPRVFGHLWVREVNKQVWRKAFFVLRNGQLLFSYRMQGLTKTNRQKTKEASPAPKEEEDLQLYADLKQFYVYTTLNAKNHFKAPTEFGLCLRPLWAGANPVQELRCVACDSERARLCWLTAMRLAQDGSKLRESFRLSRVKMATDSRNQSPKEYSSHQLPNESIRSRVAMDFTGPYGRIVEDPQEAKAIAVAEGYFWKRRRKPSGRQTPCANQGATAMLGSGTQIPLGSSVPASMSGFALINSGGLNSGIHITQPWFHSGLSREEAAQLLGKHGTVDGVFVVRESRSKTGVFVLSYVFRGKIFHAQITSVVDQGLGNVLFTLDGGKTRFYDLLQLVEFYQLNAVSLPTRLTYYVTQIFNGSHPIASCF